MRLRVWLHELALRVARRLEPSQQGVRGCSERSADALPHTSTTYFGADAAFTVDEWDDGGVTIDRAVAREGEGA